MFTFWEKNKSGLSRPQDIPDCVGRDIITKLQGDPDKIWKLKAVIRPKEGHKDTCEVRVFDGTQASSRKITVEDYNSLTEHQELILYEGWYEKIIQGKTEIKKR